MLKLPNHTALKEWAAVISALRNGDQTVLVRKGGIADPAFGVEAERFYLFPTYLHQKEKQFRPEYLHHFTTTNRSGGEPEQVGIDTWCEVAGLWRVVDLDLLRKLGDRVIFTGETFEERFRFRPDQAVHVIAVRAFSLPGTVAVKNQPLYAGCRSWISVEEEIDVSGSVPVIREPLLEETVAEINSLLGTAPARSSSIPALT